MLLNLRMCLAHHSEHWQDCMYTEACWFWGTGIISRLAGLLCLPLTILFLTTHTFTCLPLNLIPAILLSNSLVIYMFSLPFLALCVWQSVDPLLILTPHQQHFLNLLNVCIIWWETTWRQNVPLVKAGLYSDHIKNEQVQNRTLNLLFSTVTLSESPTQNPYNRTLSPARREELAKIRQRQLANAVHYIWETGEDKFAFRYFHTGFWESCEKHSDGKRHTWAVHFFGCRLVSTWIVNQSWCFSLSTTKLYP